MLAPVLAVGGVVFDANQKVLLVQRRNPPAAGSWTLPGGKVHFGEPLSDALIRELQEETGLLVDVLGLVQVVELIDPAYHYVIHDYLCRPRSDPALARAADDALALDWVPKERLIERAASLAVRQVVQQAAAMLPGAASK